MSTKIHACIDALGNGVRLLATGGQAGDCPQALALLADLSPSQVIADTSYDSDENRAYCAEKGIDVVIPTQPHRAGSVRRRTVRRPQQNRTVFQSHETPPPAGNPLRKNDCFFPWFLAYRGSTRLAAVNVLTL